MDIWSLGRSHFIKEILEERYADAEKVVLVMDNLNTHNIFEEETNLTIL